MLNTRAADAPVRGCGFRNVTFIGIASTNSEAGRVTRAWVGEINVVGRMMSPKTPVATSSPLTNPDPVNVTTVLGAPKATLLGDRLVNVGVAFETGSENAALGPPEGAGTVTTMAAVPAVVISVPGTTALRRVLLTSVVVSGVPANDICAPAT
jgi:hypothetical protein